MSPKREQLYSILSSAEPFDDALAFAVEEYRGRRIATIDAELEALGVDPIRAEAAA